MMQGSKPKIAILDMNDNEPNQGLRCIIDIVKDFEQEVDFQIFNFRGAGEIPDSSFDIYISSGGPGSPLEQKPWRDEYLKLIQELWDINNKPGFTKKHVFFICYSFQVVCDYFKLGEIKPRKSTSFGIFPIHKTKMGMVDDLYKDLANPFFAVDSRDWQLIQPKLKVFKEHGATILSLEKIRSHIEYERAIMAVRFSEEFVGTQFHPEADPVGMKAYFMDETNKQIVINNHGEAKYEQMMDRMDDPDKIIKTHETILPTFISGALKQIQEQLISYR